MAQERHIVDQNQMTELEEVEKNLARELIGKEGQAAEIIRKGLLQLSKIKHREGEVLMQIGERLWK
jgi:pimeloyl-CoA synthetase|tara:strand:- start:110 stop:307 length:198 start_codon:yes stop_codon:yes gene_type:complete